MTTGSVARRASLYVKPLNERAQKYAACRAQGMPAATAARQVGFPGNGYSLLERDPRVIAEIQKQQQKFERENQMTRKRVMDGLLSAIDHAKLVSEPASEIAGWREIAKICGYYEPITHKLDISVNGKMTLQALQSMSDEELLRIAEGKTLEGEFTELRTAIQHTPDNDPEPQEPERGGTAAQDLVADADGAGEASADATETAPVHPADVLELPGGMGS